MVLKYDPPHYLSLKISYDDINSRNDPYQLFLDNIKSPETARKYKKLLEKFLRSIPDQVYEKKSKKSDVKSIVKYFVDLAKKNPDLAADIIATYIKEEKKLVESGLLSSGTLENHIKPIKVLLDANRIAIHWKSLHKLYPRKQSTTEDRAYTKSTLQSNQISFPYVLAILSISDNLHQFPITTQTKTILKLKELFQPNLLAFSWIIENYQNTN